MSAELRWQVSRLRSKYALFRWLSVKIECANLPQFVLAYDKANQVEHIRYTTEAMELIRKLIRYSVHIYNASHPNEDSPITPDETWESVREIFDKDRQELTRERSIPT